MAYSAICKVCGWKRKDNELQKRWDGLMVCGDTCWEPRNILDFYKPRNDAHKLPWTSPDDTAEFTYTPVTTGITGTVVIVYEYSYRVESKLFSFSIRVTPTTTATFNNATFTIPPAFTGATNNGGTVIGTVTGKLLDSLRTSGASSIVTNKAVLTFSEAIMLRGSITTT